MTHAATGTHAMMILASLSTSPPLNPTTNHSPREAGSSKYLY